MDSGNVIFVRRGRDSDSSRRWRGKRVIRILNKADSQSVHANVRERKVKLF